MGTLYVVATPIGNLEDVTQRALAVLREAGLVLAEDTRRTRVLLDRYGIAARPLSLHAHNETARTQQVLAKRALPPVAERVRLLPTRFGEESGMLGAALLAWAQVD